MYNRRRKFQIIKDTISQIEQPYNYVGLKGKTLKAITLYKEKTGFDVVAQLSKDHEIEILLAESSTPDFEPDTLFLVKTDFGLVGWLRLAGFAEQVIEGLYYKGD
jgi:hypothetical protein